MRAETTLPARQQEPQPSEIVEFLGECETIFIYFYKKILEINRGKDFNID